MQEQKSRFVSTLFDVSQLLISKPLCLTGSQLRHLSQMPPLGERPMEQSETLPAAPHSILAPLVRAVVELPRDKFQILAPQRLPVLVTASGDEQPGEFHAIKHCMVASLTAKNRHRMGRVSHEDDTLFRGLVEVMSRDEDAPTEPVVHLVFLDRLGVQQHRERRHQRLTCYFFQQLFRG